MAMQKVFALAATLAALVAGAQAAGEFVSVTGTRFSTTSCPDFAISGYNSFQVVESAANLCCGGSASLGTQFDLAAQNDFTVVRLFAYSVQQGINNQITASTTPANVVYNESMLVALDNVVAQMSRRNLKAILVLANNWNYNPNSSDTKSWYTNQTVANKSPNPATNPDDFWTNPTAQQYYLANAKNIMQRKNTVSGLSYNADPTIMSWDLINEGRCEYAGCTAAGIYTWFAQVAPIVKSYAPNQLVTTGIDGFYQESNCASNVINPVPNSDGWPLRTGQDFLPNHIVNGIDYASIHLWPDNWDRTDLDYGKAWLNNHMQQAQQYLKKPLLLEEFGKAVGGTQGAGQTVEQQIAYYNVTYAITEASINAGNALRGVLFWRWDAVDPTVNLTGLDQASTLSSDSQSFTQTILPFSQRLAQRCPSAAPHTAGAPSGAASGPVTSSAGRRLKQSGSGTVLTAPTPTAITTSQTPSTPSAVATPTSAQAAVPVTGVSSTQINGQVSGAACTVDTSVGTIAG